MVLWLQIQNLKSVARKQRGYLRYWNGGEAPVITHIDGQQQHTINAMSDNENNVTPECQDGDPNYHQEEEPNTRLTERTKRYFEKNLFTK